MNVQIHKINVRERSISLFLNRIKYWRSRTIQKSSYFVNHKKFVHERFLDTDSKCMKSYVEKTRSRTIRSFETKHIFQLTLKSSQHFNFFANDSNLESKIIVAVQQASNHANKAHVFEKRHVVTFANDKWTK